MTEAFYGLPKRVLFCKHCVISNQRPSSTVEFKHTSDEKKATIGFDDEGVFWENERDSKPNKFHSVSELIDQFPETYEHAISHPSRSRGATHRRKDHSADDEIDHHDSDDDDDTTESWSDDE